MLNGSLSIWLGVTFVLIGAINVWLILQASARVRDAKASTRLMAAHRIGGYLFIALFCVMGYFMVARAMSPQECLILSYSAAPRASVASSFFSNRFVFATKFLEFIGR